MASNDPIDETIHGRAPIEDGAATTQGADDDNNNMSQQEVAQEPETRTDLSVDHQDENSSTSRSTSKALSPDAKADLDSTAKGEVSHDTSSSSSPLRDALTKAETAIFDAYKDLVALKTSSSNDGPRDDLLTSALTSLETAMKTILVAQGAAGASAQTQMEVARAHQERGAGEPALGVLPPTVQSKRPRDDAGVASTEPRRKEQATQALPPPQGSSAPQSGSTSSTSQTSESIDTAKCTTPHAQTAAPEQPAKCLPDAQAAAPEQPTKSWPDGWVELHANLNETLCDLVAFSELRECKEARSWQDHVTALRPGAVLADMILFNTNNVNGTVDPNNVERGESCAHEGWDISLNRIHRNTPLWRGRALHIMKEGNPYEPMATRWRGALPTILRSVTSIPKQQQQQEDGAGTSAQPTVEWTTVRIREHRL